MTRLLIVLLVVLGASRQLPSSSAQVPSNAAPGAPRAIGNESPEGPLPPTAPDPAAVTFTSELGVLLVAVKPAAVADFEAVIVALQEVFSKAEDEETRAIAKSWRVYKAADGDVKTAALYVYLLQPPLPTADYRPSLWLDKLMAGAPAELLAKYRDSFAAPPAKLGLVEFANMSIAPVPKPTNASPSAPSNGAPPKPQPR
ncbi:MAG TPA: hypothetical protein VNJ02_10115 [Vicinamibacterales bacterium]|nr:hypothetical protein [Vicinamibacterales bacterium]